MLQLWKINVAFDDVLNFIKYSLLYGLGERVRLFEDVNFMLFSSGRRSWYVPMMHGLRDPIIFRYSLYFLCLPHFIQFLSLPLVEQYKSLQPTKLIASRIYSANVSRSSLQGDFTTLVTRKIIQGKTRFTDWVLNLYVLHVLSIIW